MKPALTTRDLPLENSVGRRKTTGLAKYIDKRECDSVSEVWGVRELMWPRHTESFSRERNDIALENDRSLQHDGVWWYISACIKLNSVE